MDWITLGGWVVFVTCIRVMDEAILWKVDYLDKSIEIMDKTLQVIAANGFIQ